MKKLLAPLLAISMSGIIITNSNNQLIIHNTLTNKYNHDTVDIILTVPFVPPIRVDYCLPASIVMVLSTFDVSYYDQDFINERVQGLMSNAVDYMNSVSQMRSLNVNFSLLNLPNNYGSRNNDILFFQQYVTNSLGRGVPVILGYNGTGPDGHAIVITGLRIDPNNALETDYLINDPANRNPITYTGHQMTDLLNNGGSVIGSGNNFDFNKRKIKIKMQNKKVYKRVSSGSTENENFNVNFQDAGIVSTNELNQANNIEFTSLTLNENWNGKSDSYSGDSWNPANITGNQPWVEWTHWEYLHNYWFATAKLWWWDSTKIISQGLKNTVVDFQYYYAKMIASGSTIDVRLNYGDSIILSY